MVVLLQKSTFYYHEVNLLQIKSEAIWKVKDRSIWGIFELQDTNKNDI